MSSPSEITFLSDSDFDDYSNTGNTNTRDTSLVSEHIHRSEFFEQLNTALKTAWPTRHVQYTAVSVLMISWEGIHQESLKRELDQLQSVFRDLYHYSVERWLIPSKTPQRETRMRITKFWDENFNKPKTLLILYYAGHARQNPDGKFPFWVPSPKPDESLHVDTAGIHSELVKCEEGSPDLLLLYDCCFATSAHRSGAGASQAAAEGLFAGGFESRVPLAGPDSFTQHLIDELGMAAESYAKLTVIELHHRLIMRLQNYDPRLIFDHHQRTKVDATTGGVLITKARRVTPLHLFFGQPIIRQITLSPLLENGEEHVLSSEPPDNSFSKYPKVLLAIRLADGEQNEREFKEWMLSAPEGVVEFLNMLPSYSDLLLITVPVAVWDLLPDCPAVSFVGFTTGPAQASLPTPLKEKESIVQDSATKDAAAKDPVVKDRVMNEPSPSSSTPLPSSHTQGCEPTILDSVAASDELTEYTTSNLLKKDEDLDIEAMIARNKKAWAQNANAAPQAPFVEHERRPQQAQKRVRQKDEGIQESGEPKLLHATAHT